MYARAELDGDHDQYWSCIREQLATAGVQAPASLSQQACEADVWAHPRLLLSQTCGMPFRNGLHQLVKLIGTPDFALDECPPGYYRSAIVVHRDDPRTELAQYRDALFAYNQANSQSGYSAAFWHLQALNFWFNRFLATGQHVESARAVSEKRADLASLDAQTWKLMQRYDTDIVQDLRVIAWTTPSPGLPYICATAFDAEILFTAIEHAIAELPAMQRERLGIRGVVRIPEQRYLSVPDPTIQPPNESDV